MFSQGYREARSGWQPPLLWLVTNPRPHPPALVTQAECCEAGGLSMYLSTANYIYDDSKVDVSVCASIIRNSIPNVIKTGLV